MLPIWVDSLHQIFFRFNLEVLYVKNIHKIYKYKILTCKYIDFKISIFLSTVILS